MSRSKASSGQLFEIASVIVRHVPCALADMDATTLQGWIDDRSGAVAKALRSAFVPTDGLALGAVYPLKVNRDLGLNPLIAAGHYNYENPNIAAANFPIKGSGISEQEAILVHFNRNISTDAALEELDRMGLRAGDIVELLAFGEQHPEVQGSFPIAELASVWTHHDGDRCVAYLWGSTGERDLCLNVVAHDWGDHYRFLAFRKSQN